jgi:deoxyribose-phosphate aldolase
MHDLKLMRKFSLPHIQVQAAGGIRSLDDVLRVKSVGVGRVSATSSQAIIEQAKARDYK